MKLKISRGEKTQIIDVDFWSFLKCVFIAEIVIMAITYSLVFILFFIIGMLL